VNFYQTTRHYNPGDNHLRIYAVSTVDTWVCLEENSRSRVAPRYFHVSIEMLVSKFWKIRGSNFVDLRPRYVLYFFIFFQSKHNNNSYLSRCCTCSLILFNETYGSGWIWYPVLTRRLLKIGLLWHETFYYSREITSYATNNFPLSPALLSNSVCSVVLHAP
jgi:hypothetical protein